METFNGGAGNDGYTGTAGNDTIYGNNGNDTLRGEGGQDLIYGGANNDSLFGGAGDDVIYYGTGADTVYGGDGNDFIDDVDGFDGTNNTNLLYGDSGNDTFFGSAGADTIFGGGDNDSMNGESGSDLLYGDAGNDTILGANGQDSIFGGDGADNLFGGNDNDQLYGGLGNDFIQGDGGDDTIFYGAGSDTVFGGHGADFIDDIGGFDSSTEPNQLFGGDGNDTIFGSAGNDSIFGGNDNDFLRGESGNDIILGNHGSDTIYGDAGDDSIRGGDGSDIVYAGTGNDLIYGGDLFQIDTLTGEVVDSDGFVFSDTLFGGDGNDTIYGSTAEVPTTASAIFGGNGNDFIWATNGADTVLGGQGADSIVGFLGDDVLFGGAGGDQLFGFEDNDTLSGDGLFDASVRVANSSFSAGAAHWNLTGAGTLVRNDSLSFNTQDDAGLNGTATQTINVIAGNLHVLEFDAFEYGLGSGSHTIRTDVVDGNGNVIATRTDTITNDTRQELDLQFTSTTETVTLRFVNTAFTQTVNTDVRIDSISVTDLTQLQTAGSDTLAGGDGDDVLYGNGQGDALYGENGNDTIYGDSPTVQNVPLVNASFTGNTNGWTTSGSVGTYPANGVALNQFDSPNNPSSVSQTFGTQAGLEYQVSVDASEFGTGSATHTVRIEVLDPNGTVVAVSTYNIINGATENITVPFVATSDNMTLRISNPSSTGTDRTDLVVENIQITTVAPFTPGGNDTISGAIGNDLIYGEDGSDALSGGEGNDTIYGDTVGANPTKITVANADFNDISSNDAANWTIVDPTAVDTVQFYQVDGNRAATFNAGNDNITGGSISQTISVLSGKEYVLAADAQEYDAFGGVANHTLRMEVFDQENILIATRDFVIGNDTQSRPELRFTATTDAVTIWFSNPASTASNDSDLRIDNIAVTLVDDIVRTTGNDTIAGGTGNDLLYGEEGDDRFVFENGFGNDTIFGGATGETAGDVLDLENVTSNITLTSTAREAGTFTDGVSTANFSDIEVLRLGSGNDTITGDVGSNLIYAGGGADLVYGGASGASESNVIYGGTGNDTIYGDVTGSSDVIFGGDDNDRIFGGNGGADTLYGDAGADTISGGTDSDLLYGGTGNDVLYGDGATAVSVNGLSRGATDTLYGNEGSDTIYANQNTDLVNTTDGALIYGGTDDDLVYGSAANDTLFGDQGADTLYGNGGDDVIIGGDGGGSNLIYGGDGADTITGGANDTGGIIGDTLFGGTGNDLIYGTALNDLISGDEGNDRLFGGVGNDTLSGGAGADTLYGGDGNDRINVGEGDSAFGDAGDDSFGVTGLTGGNATVAGGDGTDTLDLTAANADRTVNVTNRTTNTDGSESRSGTVTFGDGSVLTFTDIERIICFGAGTLIRTVNGDVPVENLEAGDAVLTVDNGYKEIAWAGKNRITAEQLAANPALRPVRIPKGALGMGLPTQALIISPQHRVFVRSAVAERMVDAPEVLVAAKHLVGTAGIHIAEDVTEVEYHHFLFDQHELVWSNGAPTESLFTGPEALKAVSPEAREEILALFPQLADVDYRDLGISVRPIVNGRLGRQLAKRHFKNSKPLLG